MMRFLASLRLKILNKIKIKEQDFNLYESIWKYSSLVHQKLRISIIIMIYSA